MIEAQELTGYISQDKTLTGELSKTIEVLKPITQEKVVTPTKEIQIIEPDKDFTGLSKVTVEPIPDEYIIPSGEVEFTQNGTYDVTDKASAKVNIKEKVLGTKKITSNGTYKAIDDSLDGYSKVEVETAGVDINEYYQTNTDSIFNVKRYILEVPTFDLNGCINAYAAFDSCSKLKKSKLINTNSVQTMTSLYGSCTAITTISKFNCDNVNNISNICGYCYKLENLGGFENLGQNYSTTQNENYNNYKLDLHWSNDLTHESLMNVINNLYDIATKGCKPQQLILSATNLAKLTSEEIAIATNKGWNVS